MEWRGTFGHVEIGDILVGNRRVGVVRDDLIRIPLEERLLCMPLQGVDRIVDSFETRGPIRTIYILEGAVGGGTLQCGDKNLTIAIGI